MNILLSNINTYLHFKQQKNPIILIPIGCIENHGHLPLGTDSLIAKKISEEITKHNSNVILTPVINYGCHSLPDSGGGFHMPGTICMENILFIQHLEKVVEEYMSEGFSNFVFLNCHFENSPAILDTITRLYKQHNDKKLKLAQICYWDLSSQNVLDKVFPKGFDPKIEHAGISETSIIMYLFPELNIDCKNVKIKSSNQHKFDLFDFEKMNNEICTASVLADPTESSAVKGKILWDDFISNINKIIATTF